MKNVLIQLQNNGFDVHFNPETFADLRKSCRLLEAAPVPDLTAAVSKEILEQTEVLITGWGSNRIEKEHLERMPRLELVAHLAGSVKAVITPEVLQSGIRVTQAAAINAKPVAQFALAIIILHNKRIPDWVQAYRQDRASYRMRQDPLNHMVGNRGRTIGIVGASRVGRSLISLLQPHGLRVVVHDPFQSDAEIRALGAEPVSLHQLLRESDVVTLHQPLLPETYQSFGAKEFALMKDGALFLNTARGAIVDHDALAKAMSGGRLFAVLDVTYPEPLPDASPLWDMPNVVLTPHVAGSVGSEVADMTDGIIDEICRYSQGKPLLHEVSIDLWEQVA